MSHLSDAYFSDNYSEARMRFVRAAQSKNAQLHRLPLGVDTADGVELIIDIAWLGSPDAKQVVIHSSGLHGVEGFAGSAIQLALLDQDLRVADDCALVLVHVLNPFGMSCMRRFNENNVDLNRNFGEIDDDRSGASEHYLRLRDFLNPRSPPTADFFYLHALGLILRYGLSPLKQAIAEGQFEFPEGLFFGGKLLERGPSLYQTWLAGHLTSLDRVFAIDVHTGLGKRCQESLFLHQAPKGGHGLSEALGRRLASDLVEHDVGYEIRGGYTRAFDALPGQPQLYSLMQEFGTYSSVRVLHALREENRWHHYGDGSLSHQSKMNLKEMFAPAAADWRESVLGDGVSLVQAAMRYMFD